MFSISLAELSMNPAPESPDTTEDRPPILKSWGVLYATVLTELALLILLFYVFTKAFE